MGSETNRGDGGQQGEVMVIHTSAGQWPQGHQKRSRSKRGQLVEGRRCTKEGRR